MLLAVFTGDSVVMDLSFWFSEQTRTPLLKIV
jgi:hypothetical protein